MNKALSGDEILDALNHKTKILIYTDLKKYNSVNELLNPYGCVVILYLNSKNMGHWTCLFRNKDNHNEFFDSYGLPPDSELAYIPNEKRIELKQLSPLLSKLLLKDKRKIIYNNHRLQKLAPKINTCGRHVIMRLIGRDIDIDDYNKIMHSTNLTPDQLVTKLTKGV
jgi:hypothetical protein